jgi:flagellar protein FliT
MQDSGIIGYYEAIARASASMLAAARRSDWDALLEIEQTCRQIIEQIKAYGDNLELHGPAHARKMEVIRQVLADDAEIRNLMNPWLRHLETILHGSARGKEAARAYGGSSQA